MRLFLAIMPTAELAGQAAAVQERLRAAAGDDGIRWTRPEQFHYTLKFLGEQSLARTRKVVEGALATTPAIAPFDLTLAGVGGFPTEARPSVLWMGASDGAAAFAEFAAVLDMMLHQRGFGRETRSPKPHLTLARIKGYRGEAAAARALATHSALVGEVGKFRVGGFALMQSAPGPTGSAYSVVEQFTLIGSNDRA